MKTVLTVLALSMFATAPAMARSAETVSKAVSHADLDISTAAGRERLDRRLQVAARTVCGVGGTVLLAEQVRQRRCYKTAIGSAREKATLAVLSREGDIRVATR